MAIKVRALNDNMDWGFGLGKAQYIDGDNAIIQNVKTRLKSLKNDFFLDTEANIDWLNILGQLSNKETIINEIYRVTLATDGVIAINKIDILTVEKRNATIAVDFATINSTNILIELGILNG